MKLLQQTRRSQEDLSKQDRVLVRKIKQDDNIYQNKLTDWVKQRASKCKHFCSASQVSAFFMIAQTPGDLKVKNSIVGF